MNIQFQKSLQSLITKLSAVRVTLSDDEQVIMDWLIQIPRSELNADEVEAHVIQRGILRGSEQAIQRGADEVEAHAIQRGILRGSEQAIQRGADEVEAHAIQRGSEEGVMRGVEMFKIFYDPELEAYRIVMK